VKELLKPFVSLYEVPYVVVYPPRPIQDEPPAVVDKNKEYSIKSGMG
jgi:hypothetical protein